MRHVETPFFFEGETVDEKNYLSKLQSVVFQQDGALRSPNLISLSFYLWGHLKSNVYKSPIKDMDELTIRIEKEIKSISK